MRQHAICAGTSLDVLRNDIVELCDELAAEQADNAALRAECERLRGALVPLRAASRVVDILFEPRGGPTCTCGHPQTTAACPVHGVRSR
jgi:hypothetical protein